MSAFEFDHEAFLPTALFEEITDVRVNRSEVIEEEAERRERRTELAPDGNLLVLADRLQDAAER
ncbi:MAG: hypothetical protein ABEH77_05675 [Halobacteriaceae archaeon]